MTFSKHIIFSWQSTIFLGNCWFLIDFWWFFGWDWRTPVILRQNPNKITVLYGCGWDKIPTLTLNFFWMFPLAKISTQEVIQFPVIWRRNMLVSISGNSKGGCMRSLYMIYRGSCKKRKYIPSAFWDINQWDHVQFKRSVHECNGADNSSQAWNTSKFLESKLSNEKVTKNWNKCNKLKCEFSTNQTIWTK